MSKTKHTPGPWRIEQVAIDTVTIVEATQKGRLVFNGTFRLPECAMGNAALIAAAPEMLEVLEWLVKSFPELQTDEEISGADVVEHLSTHWHLVTEALAKAKGEA